MRLSTLFTSFFFYSCYNGQFSFSTPTPQPYASIFSFGDSYTDTGNFRISGASKFPLVLNPPYGMTYFGHPTGRCSDGRLIIDFFGLHVVSAVSGIGGCSIPNTVLHVAEAFGLPLLPPYLARNVNFRKGANFAVVGATALDPSFFQAIGAGSALFTNHSLNTQLRWFEELKPSLCNTTSDCKEYFAKSLFFVGEIGGNDYGFSFLAGKSLPEVTTYVARVVETIAGATERLIKHGAVELVVPGIPPMGCAPLFLTQAQSLGLVDYDPQSGCLKPLNDFSEYHNSLLHEALQQVRMRQPRARIIYGDFYGPGILGAQSPGSFGFKHGATVACCGGDSPGNVTLAKFCGSSGARVCNDPSTYINWDGIHLTEAAYHGIASVWLRVYFAHQTGPRIIN